MQEILDFLRTNVILIILCIVNIGLIIGYIINQVKIKRIEKSYNDFLEKVGDGKNFQKTLNKYIDQVNKVTDDLNELGRYCEKMNHNMSECIQKVGVVRYNALKNVGSDLSFAIALLDKNNTGVVLNGVYTQEHTNVYSKPIIKGTSRYNLSDEEKQAIKQSIYNSDIGKIK